MMTIRKLINGIASIISQRFLHANALAPIELTTRTIIPYQSPRDVHDFLASPGNWPKIVSTSMGVASAEDVSKPLSVGKTVDELFGLPPILPLYVTWTCTKSQKPAVSSSKTSSSSSGRLAFFSPGGLKGVAEDCEMIFDVNRQSSQSSLSNQKDGTEVVLTMKYSPMSILAVLAVPILTIDNSLAIMFLLPAAMRTQPELDKFRNLMGSLYCGAGLAHLADCWWGGSQLLTMAEAPAFTALPLTGQLFALLWCAMGPVAFALTKLGGSGFADIGLILYGLVEVMGAGLIEVYYGTGSEAIMNPLINAILVQAVVAGAWFYSANKATPNEVQS
jgi:hypothetical protein